MTRLLEQDRELLLRGLRDALAGSSSLARIVRQHAGVEDEAGKPGDGAGKLLRPSLVLFVAGELGARVSDALPGAVALELVHNFSLVHDDIQDRDKMRRGRPTLWAVYGEAEAINAGDYLFAAAFRAAAQSPGAAACIAEATMEMIEGQSLDLSYEDRFVSIGEYMVMVDKKTGALLRCALDLGGLAAGAFTEVRESLRSLGRSLGRAFQVRDDALGIWGDDTVVGKPQGSDVRRRKKSFPVVFTHEQARAGDRRKLEDIYSREPVSEEDVRWVVRLMERSAAPAAADAAVREHLAAAQAALDGLPFSPSARSELLDFSKYLAGRTK